MLQRARESRTMYTPFLVGLAAGLAAQPHCLGMCGGFPVYVAQSPRRRTVRQALFIAGKLFTYVFLGGLAAFFGSVVLRAGVLPEARRLLSTLAGAAMALVALGMIGFRLPPVLRGVGAALSEPIRAVATPLLKGGEPVSAFGLGMVVGFFPCPVTAALLLQCAAWHSVPTGLAAMAGMGVGTAPVLLAAGAFGAGLRWPRLRQVGLKVAAVVVLLLGLTTLARGSGLLPCCMHANHAAVGASHSASQMPSCCQQ